MLRQIERGLQNRPFTKNRVLPLLYFAEDLISVYEPIIDSGFNVKFTQILYKYFSQALKFSLRLRFPREYP